MFAHISRLESGTGASLAVRHEPAGPQPIGILLISHGLAEHSGRYRAFAETMSGHGFEVYAHDHRGHGETHAADAPLGRFARRNGAASVLEDLKAVRNMAAARQPGLPVILLGHSMGGLIALNAATSQPGCYDGVAVWNANFNPGLAGRAARFLLTIERALKGSDVPSDLLPRLTFQAWGRAIPNHRTGFDWLSHDEKAVDDYIADPLCGFDASVSLWLDILELTFRGPRHISRLPKSLAIHVAGGDEDPATNFGRECVWLARRLIEEKLTDVTTKIWPGTRHETLNDTIKQQATQEFATWAKDICTKKR